jgi:hypothetical protein
MVPSSGVLNTLLEELTVEWWFVEGVSSVNHNIFKRANPSTLVTDERFPAFRFRVEIKKS